MTAARAYITMVQSEYAIRMAIKLLCIAATDGWDPDHARNVLDLPSTMEMAVSKIESIVRVRSREGELPNRDYDVFAKYLDNLKCVKDWSQSLETSSGAPKSSFAAGFGPLDAETGPQDQEFAYHGDQSLYDGFLSAINSDSLLWDASNGQVEDWMAFGS